MQSGPDDAHFTEGKALLGNGIEPKYVEGNILVVQDPRTSNEQGIVPVQVLNASIGRQSRESMLFVSVPIETSNKYLFGGAADKLLLHSQPIPTSTKAPRTCASPFRLLL